MPDHCRDLRRKLQIISGEHEPQHEPVCPGKYWTPHELSCRDSCHHSSAGSTHGRTL